MADLNGIIAEINQANLNFNGHLILYAKNISNSCLNTLGAIRFATTQISLIRQNIQT